jgi:SAM-dependent methyltransferase
MTSVAGAVGAPALERARRLLRVSEAGDRGATAPGGPRAYAAPGYLDLLGERAAASTGRAQDLMLGRAVPRIYEQTWRPALGRIAKGPRGPSMEGELRLARELLRLEHGGGATVLDVACGTGGFTRELARTVGGRGLVVGIDVSGEMLSRAVARARGAGLPNVAYVRGDAEDLPFEDEAFDAVCCFAALHLFSDPWRGLDRFRAVLRPGGRVAIMTSVRRGPLPLRPVESVIGALSGMRVFERDQIVQALAARGFEEIGRHLAGVTQIVAATRA